MSSFEKIRIGGSKVRTGCRTCKARRVKCDEGKPSCHRCVKAGRNCDGYSPSPEPAHTPAGHRFIHYVDPIKNSLSQRPFTIGMTVSRSPSPYADLDNQALRALDFFHSSSIMLMEQHFEHSFWTRSLSCIMQQNEAIKHGVIAFATLHEIFLYASASSYEDDRKIFALEHYGKSIKDVVYQNRKNPKEAALTTLIMCLLYCAIEGLQGHYFSALKHIVAGTRCLNEYESQLIEREKLGQIALEGFTDSLRRIFISLGTQAMGLDDCDIDAALIEHAQTSEEIVTYSFDSPDQALADIANLLNDILRFSNWAESQHGDPDFPNDALRLASRKFDSKYRNWTRLYHELLSKHDGDEKHVNSTFYRASLVLRVNQILMRILLDQRLETTQMSFDASLEDFRGIVNTSQDLMVIEAIYPPSEQIGSEPFTLPTSSIPTFSMTLGIVHALFFTCTRCRDPVVRRQALALLKGARRREAVWDSQVVGDVAERIINIEEDHARQYWYHRRFQKNETLPHGNHKADAISNDEDRNFQILSAEDVPECVRIRGVEIDRLEALKDAKISFLQASSPQTITHTQTQHIVWE